MNFAEILLQQRILTHDKISDLASINKVQFERSGSTYIFPAQNIKVEIQGGWSIFNKNWKMSTFLPRVETNGVPFS